MNSSKDRSLKTMDYLIKYPASETAAAMVLHPTLFRPTLLPSKKGVESPKLSFLGTLTISLILIQFSSTLIAQGTDSAEELAQKNSTIYKSVDASGRISYSDEPNPRALQEKRIILREYESSESAEDIQARIDTMARTTKRLQEDRRAREEDRRRNEQSKRPPPPPIIIDNRVVRAAPYYRRRGYPRLYPPYAHPLPGHHESHHQRSSLGLNISGGSSKFRYGLSYGTQQSQHKNTHIQTPYRRDYNNASFKMK